ncbi:hypothetical protein BB561_006104 [Smittium simulii]|uniref:Glucose-6-phosphate 1-epimerase n=1 Tax=Smittium simulii TaxID=133385 RepID=A0A2T9Y6K6_9FUNG|nr:hypothetical protein BB561_006104 [Smittium simulii]
MPLTAIKDNSGKIFKYVLIDSSDSAVEIHPHGATITSWVAGGKQRLFLSKKAILDGSKPIRGGIPLVFPQFGPGKLKQHGFARDTVWELLGYKDQSDGVKAKFLLSENSSTLGSLWPYKFRLVYTILLSQSSLKLSFELKNTDQNPFSFTTLFHTYFVTSDIENVRVNNLEQTIYDDKIEKSVDNKETSDAIRFTKSVDRVYKNTVDELKVTISNDESILITKKNLNDIVLWNPWAEIAKGMSDFGDEEYKTMFCAEAGSVSTPIELQPGNDWECHMQLTLQ